LRALPATLHAWRDDDAQLVFSEGRGERVTVHSLVDRNRAQQGAAALVRALMHRAVGRIIHVPQLQRHAVGGAALEKLGFARLPLSQSWMRLPF
jgi:hypothetical protein